MSDNYIVSARKYRPSTFRSVVGQKSLTSTLRNSIRTGRLGQAYLFCGPRGVGKTSCARIFAKTINCLTPDAEGEACGKCASCRAIEEGTSFNIVELDAASNNSVDDIRSINEQVNIPPQSGKYRVFIIDEVHMLSNQAFNAFLKTLEEPPAYAIFILATTEKHKVIPTILSRCQIYDFRRITLDDIVDHLGYVAREEGMTADPAALGVIARKADGAMRDALSIFDQVAASTGGNLTYQGVVENLNVLDYEYFFRLVDTFAKGDAPQALLYYKEIRDRGFDSLFFVNNLASHIRDLMVAADARTLSLLETPSDVAERLAAQARALPLRWYYKAMELLNDCDLNYRTASNKQFLVELTLIRLCQLLNPSGAPGPDKPQPLRNPAASPSAAGAAPSAAPSASAGAPHAAAPSAGASAPHAAPSASAAAPGQPAPIDSARDCVASPAAAPRPAASPRTAAPRTASHARPTTTNLNTAAQNASRPRTEQREEFSDADLSRAWEEFIRANSGHPILTSAMRKALPTRTDGAALKITVDHPAQGQAFEQNLPRLLEWLRSTLRNDTITLSVAVETPAENMRHLPPQEFLKKIIAENPPMGDLLRHIDAEIS